MLCARRYLTEVSVAIINDLPSALFNSSIFLSSDGPAATIIAGISFGIFPIISET